MSEKEVFEQKVSEEELNSVAGGDDCGRTAYDHNVCTTAAYRDIYWGGFPNCAATVEDGSWCGSNDACIADDVKYLGMKDCERAWR